MTQNEHEQNLSLAKQIKQASDDMQIVADELKQLPKGQLKKLQASERLNTVLGKYGVEI